MTIGGRQSQRCELRTSAEAARLIRMESLGLQLPPDTVEQLLRTLSQHRVHDVVLKWAIRICGRRKDANFSLLTAVLSGIVGDNHELAYSAISRQIQKELPGFEPRNQKSIKTVLHRIAYLLTLLHSVQRDARNRIAAPFKIDHTLSLLSEQLQLIAGDESAALTEVVHDLLLVTREFADKSSFAQDLRFWLGTRLFSGLAGLSRLLTIAQSSDRAQQGLFLAYEEVVSAIDRSYPTRDSLVRYIRGTTRDLGKGFGKRSAITAKVLMTLGRETDLKMIFEEILDIEHEIANRVVLAEVLIKTDSRWAIRRGVKLLQKRMSTGSEPSSAILNLRAQLACADWEQVRHSLNIITRDPWLKKNVPTSIQYGAWKALGELDLAAALLEELLTESLNTLANAPSRASFGRLQFCQAQKAEIEFLREVATQLDFAHATPLRGVLVILNRKVSQLAQLPLLSLRELKQRGYAVVALAPGLLPRPFTGIKAVDDIHAQLGEGCLFTRWQWGDHSEPALLNQWEIELGQKRVACRGVNFFQGLFESLCCEFRRYSIDFEDKLIQKRAADRIFEMDSIIDCIERLKRISIEHSLPVRVLASDLHLASGYAARFYTQAASRDSDIGFIGCQSGYDNYYGNFKDEIANTLALQDLTKNAEQSRPAAASVEDFERWFSAWDSSNRGPTAIPRVVFKNRIQRKNTDKNAARMLDNIMALRQGGKSVITIFGKVLFDHAVPYDGGPAHESMRDWVNHCYQIAVDHPDLVLLIKPHPHEVRDEIALFPTEVLRDWFPTELAANVFFLDHNMFNLHELRGVIDLGVVWNSTVCLELGVLGIPCTVSSWYGALDFPVSHFTPKDRADFEQHLIGAKKLRPSSETARRSAALIEYLRSEGVATPYRYAVRALTNKRPRERGWIAADLQHYKRTGDRFVQLLTDRVEQSFIG